MLALILKNHKKQEKETVWQVGWGIEKIDPKSTNREDELGGLHCSGALSW